MSLVHTESGTETAELFIRKSLWSILLLATQHYFKPEDLVQACKEREQKWCGLVKIVRSCNNELTVFDDIKSKSFDISNALSCQANSSDNDLILFYLVYAEMSHIPIRTLLSQTLTTRWPLLTYYSIFTYRSSQTPKFCKSKTFIESPACRK